MEQRTTHQPIEIRGEGSEARIVGYAAVFYREDELGTEYSLWPGCVERVMPGAFDLALREDDVYGLFNHDRNYPLARYRSNGEGTMRLSVDSVGLRYEMEPDPESPLFQSIRSSLKRKDVDGSSFSFGVRSGGESWITEKRGDVLIEVRELTSVSLFDVGPVVGPAYQATTSGLRFSQEFAEARSRFEEEQKARMWDKNRIETQKLIRDFQIKRLTRHS